MRHFKDEGDDEDHYFLGRVVFLSNRIRAFAPQARMSLTIRLLQNRVEQSRGGEASEECAVPWCGFALETERVFAESLSGEVIDHVH